MLSEVEIVNVSLSMLGLESIRQFSVTDEDPKTGRLAKRLYDMSRDSMLAAHDWSFARNSQYLQLLTADHPEGSVYKLPSDCFVPRRLLPRLAKPNTWVLVEYEGVRAIVIPSHLVSNYGQRPILRFTKSVTTTSLFPPYFSDALSVFIAARLCMPLTRNIQYRKELMSEYIALARQAQFYDANADCGDQQHDTDLENDSFLNPDGTGVIFYGE